MRDIRNGFNVKSVLFIFSIIIPNLIISFFMANIGLKFPSIIIVCCPVGIFLAFNYCRIIEKFFEDEANI